MPEMSIPEKLAPLISVKKRFKIVIGGRGSSKSTTFADIFAMKAQTEKAKIGCFREYQNSIEDSVHALLSDEINRLSIPGFSIGKATIDHRDGGKLRFKGLARSIDAVKSMHGFKYFWVEEAQFLSGGSIKILTPTVREEGSEIWFSGNPMSSADPFSQRFIVPYIGELEKNGYYEDDMHLIIFINHSDNPWFPKVLEQERMHDYQHLPRAMYDHVWEGAFNDSVENSIILAEWFDACIDAHKKLGFKPNGVEVVSHDPSDMGIDPKGLAHRHGSVIKEVLEKADGDVNQGCDWALDYTIRNQVDLFTWDCDGMGIALQSQVEKALKNKHIKFLKYKGSNRADDPDSIYEKPNDIVGDGDKCFTNRQTFKNKRAQYYWKLRDRIFNTYLAVVKGEYKDPDSMISFSSEIELLPKLRSEICRIPRKHNPNGVIQIMTKDEMKRLLKISSPNLADCVKMSLVVPDVDERDNLNYNQTHAEDNHQYF